MARTVDAEKIRRSLLKDLRFSRQYGHKWSRFLRRVVFCWTPTFQRSILTPSSGLRCRHTVKIIHVATTQKIVYVVMSEFMCCVSKWPTDRIISKRKSAKCVYHILQECLTHKEPLVSKRKSRETNPNTSKYFILRMKWTFISNEEHARKLAQKPF